MFHRHKWRVMRWDQIQELNGYPTVWQITWRCEKCGQVHTECRPLTYL